MEKQQNAFLGTEPIGKLMRKFAMPCVISLLVGALYNIVDQIFIANADYLGSYGNAANTVVFPLTVIALAIATMIGDGCCTFVSISMGARRSDDARRGVGSSVVALVAVSLVLTAIYLAFMNLILDLFGARVNDETGLSFIIIKRLERRGKKHVRGCRPAGAFSLKPAGISRFSAN